jgi:hypothetical protein
MQKCVDLLSPTTDRNPRAHRPTPRARAAVHRPPAAPDGMGVEGSSTEEVRGSRGGRSAAAAPLAARRKGRGEEGGCSPPSAPRSPGSARPPPPLTAQPDARGGKEEERMEGRARRRPCAPRAVHGLRPYSLLVEGRETRMGGARVALRRQEGGVAVKLGAWEKERETVEMGSAGAGLLFSNLHALSTGHATV